MKDYVFAIAIALVCVWQCALWIEIILKTASCYSLDKVLYTILKFMAVVQHEWKLKLSSNYG